MYIGGFISYFFVISKKKVIQTNLTNHSVPIFQGVDDINKLVFSIQMRQRLMK